MLELVPHPRLCPAGTMHTQYIFQNIECLKITNKIQEDKVNVVNVV